MIPPLTQYIPSDPLSLADDVLDVLRGRYADVVDLEVAQGRRVRLRAKKYVGVVRVGELELVIRPKISSLAVIWMMGHALDRTVFEDLSAELKEEEDIANVVANQFCLLVERIRRRGIYREYVDREENGPFVRGRMLPLRDAAINRGLRHLSFCRFNELTADVAVNRRLVSALEALRRLELTSATIRMRIHSNLLQFAEVASAVSPLAEPEVLNRLNSHYRPALLLARYILRAMSFGVQRAGAPAPCFLVDMNALFQEYVDTVTSDAARELGLERHHGSAIYLDEAKRQELRPDVVFTSARGRVVSVLDAKYKRESVEQDLYQALAYASVLRLPRVALIYPEDGDVDSEILRINDAQRTAVLVRTIPVARRGESLGELDRRARRAAAAIVRETLSEPVGAILAA